MSDNEMGVAIAKIIAAIILGIAFAIMANNMFYYHNQFSANRECIKAGKTVGYDGKQYIYECK